MEEADNEDFSDVDPMSSLSSGQTDQALVSIKQERLRQDEKFGFFRDYRDGTGGYGREVIRTAAQKACKASEKEAKTTWAHILEEEVSEALAESDENKLEVELMQVAAVAVGWMEAIRRRRDERRPTYFRKPWYLRLKKAVGL